MFRRLHPFAVILLTCFLSSLAFAQQAGRIIGQIRVQKGDFPPHPILVELQLHNATINSTYADGEGHFGFYELESNPYHIVVNDEDFYPVDEIANLNLEESQFAMVQIQLRPREKKTTDPLPKQPAGSNPFIVDPGDYEKRFPKKAVKEYEKGLESEKKGEKGKAIEYYQAALKIAPDYYPAHNNLGVLYLGKPDFKSAEEQFREAVRLDQNEAQAYFNLGNVLSGGRDYVSDRSAEAAGFRLWKFSAGKLVWTNGQAGRGGEQSAEGGAPRCENAAAISAARQPLCPAEPARGCHYAAASFSERLSHGGGRAARREGVRDNLTGWPTSSILLLSFLVTLCAMPRCWTCGSANIWSIA